MKKSVIHFLMLVSLTACGKEAKVQNNTQQEIIEESDAQFDYKEITEKYVIEELSRNLKSQNLKIDLDEPPKVFIEDVNGDNLKDAVVRFWVDNPQAHIDYGKSAIYEVLKIAVLINENNSLNLTNMQAFTDLVPLSTHGSFENENLNNNIYTVTHIEDSFDSYSSILLTFNIVNGKFVEQELDESNIGEPETVLAEINDPDGYTNLREKPTTKSKILDRIYEGEKFYVYIDDSPEKWWMVYSQKNHQTGYIHKSRVKLLE